MTSIPPNVPLITLKEDRTCVLSLPPFPCPLSLIEDVLRRFALTILALRPNGCSRMHMEYQRLDEHGTNDSMGMPVSFYEENLLNRVTRHAGDLRVDFSDFFAKKFESYRQAHQPVTLEAIHEGLIRHSDRYRCIQLKTPVQKTSLLNFFMNFATPDISHEINLITQALYYDTYIRLESYVAKVSITLGVSSPGQGAGAMEQWDIYLQLLTDAHYAMLFTPSPSSPSSAQPPSSSASSTSTSTSTSILPHRPLLTWNQLQQTLEMLSIYSFPESFHDKAEFTSRYPNGSMSEQVCRSNLNQYLYQLVQHQLSHALRHLMIISISKYGSLPQIHSQFAFRQIERIHKHLEYRLIHAQGQTSPPLAVIAVVPSMLKAVPTPIIDMLYALCNLALGRCYHSSALLYSFEPDLSISSEQHYEALLMLYVFLQDHDMLATRSTQQRREKRGALTSPSLPPLPPQQTSRYVVSSLLDVPLAAAYSLTNGHLQEILSHSPHATFTCERQTCRIAHVEQWKVKSAQHGCDHTTPSSPRDATDAQDRRLATAKETAVSVTPVTADTFEWCDITQLHNVCLFTSTSNDASVHVQPPSHPGQPTPITSSAMGHDHGHSHARGGPMNHMSHKNHTTGSTQHAHHAHQQPHDPYAFLDGYDSTMTSCPLHVGYMYETQCIQLTQKEAYFPKLPQQHQHHRHSLHSRDSHQRAPAHPPLQQQPPAQKPKQVISLIPPPLM